MSSKTETIVK